MAGPQQSIVLLDDENNGDAECVGINGSHNEKIAEERPGRRGRQERSEQRRKNVSKKSASTPVGEKELQELMRLCEYEVDQDPYRGIGFLNNRNKNNDEEDTNMVDADSNERSIAPTRREGKTLDKIVTPWDVCQWGILTMPKNTEIAQQEGEKIGHDDMSTDDNKTCDSFPLDPGNATCLVQNLTESCCPSILAWTKERLDEGIKKKQQSQRKTTGKKRNRSSCEQDGNNASIPTRFPHLGNRPLDGKYHCPCDSNPFCLGSMGGIMNELLEERCQRGITISIVDEDESVVGEKVSKDSKRANFFESGGNGKNGDGKNRKSDNVEIEIIDVDQNKKSLAAGTESEESNSVFAFMGGSKTSSFFKDKTKHLEKVKIEKKTEKTATTDATCKRLGLGWSKAEIGDPAKVYSSRCDISNHHFNEEGYSQTTKDEIDMLRGFESVDASKVKKFVKNIFDLLENSNSNEMTMDEYIQTMIEWHKSLIFVNPTIEARHSSSNNITIALPPGIQNLGATCYLNTQLQCLAQNPVFLDGIFSWRPVDATHKMNGVMEKLQALLAQLLVGGNGKYTSLDFSNALGIQHNEQQDPNEFARLLFDRMEESFQQCSTSGSVLGTNHDNVNGGNGLGKLLQRIFHGTTTYETICLKCGKTSVRSEGFMDLNLPIVQRPYFEEDDTDEIGDTQTINTSEKDEPAFVKRKRRKKGVIEKAFQKQRKSSSGNTDVQYCFDQYTKAETLDGDNQYFCDDCNCKQDAKRVMSLTELPPVLNIQLSRYVFDREKFVKKKLTDKVRLPTVLTIDQHRSVAGGNEISLSTSVSKRHKKSKKKYLLCAVMRHQGTSAYSGHYVAEAMDWTSGQWYEFNDETVKVLPAPSNSYVPYDSSYSEDEEILKEAKSAGSQDAYNMYYVDEEYLGDRAVVTMLRNQRLNSIQNGSNKIENKNIDVLSNLIREKMTRYSVLTELCFVDYAISDRLRRRKDGIRKYMFVDPTSLLLQEGQRKEDNEPYFWVDGQMLRQFLACDRSFDDKLSSGEPIICPKSLLCPHGCLHPRNARRGKLLRKSLYDSYKSLLSGERMFLSETSEVKESDVIGCVITSEERMTCEECSKSYCNELSEKLEFLRNVNDLYVDILDDTTDSTKSAKTDSIHKAIEEEYSYLVARSTITKFKKLVVDLMKSVADFAKGGYLDSSFDQSDSKNNIVLNGIDDLDLSSFPGSSTHGDCDDVKATGNAVMNDLLDEKFNSKITCSHGNCNDFSARIVRYVPYKTWVKVKKVFPNAIDHKVLIYTVDGNVRKPNVDDDGCVYCREEKDAIKNLTLDIEKWAKETKENSTLKKLLDGKKIAVGEIAFHNFDSAQNNCRLVHRDDIANLCKSVKLLGRISKLKIPDNSDMKTYVENIAFPSYHSVVLDFEKQPHARLLQSVRSLTCCEHKRVIKSAIMDTFEIDGELQERHQLSDGIAVLSNDEYNSYINSLAKLLVILNYNYQKKEDAEEGSQGNSTTLFDDVKRFVVSYHPAIRMTVGENVPCDELLLFSVDGNSKAFSIVPGICDHETCKKDFVPIIQKNVGVAVESVSVDSTDTGGEQNRNAGRKTDCRVGSIAMSPIVVESDLEDCADTLCNTQHILVFQYKADSELNDAMQSLRTVVGLPNSDNNESLNFGLRRSSRKRKAKFPVGCITREFKIDIGLHHNVAALRLLLYQNCQIPLGCNLSIALVLDDDSPPKSLEIAFDWGKETLNDLVNRLKILEGIVSNSLESNPSEHLFLLYHVAKDDNSGDIETTLMDSLLQVSNIESPDSENKPCKGKRERKRSSERGFQGTLLQSSTLSCIADEQKSTDGDGSCIQTEAKSKNVGKRERSNTIISDDEIGTQNIMVETDVISDFSDGEIAIIPSPSAQIKLSNEIGDDQKMKLVCKLIELTASKDESSCFEAVSWAIKSNPKCGEAEIIDAAFAKFFEGPKSK